MALNNTKQNNPNRVYRKVRRHMDEPRGINIAELIVQRVENQSAGNEAEHQQCQHSRMEHPNQHPHMVDGKQNRAEEISKPDIHILFQCNEPESSEEEFFQERIHDGYVDCHPDEVIRRDAHFGSQIGSHAAEIDKGTRDKVSSENHSKDGNPQEEGDEQAFLLKAEQCLEFAPFLTPECEEQHREREEKQDLYRDFREIWWMYNSINKGYCK